MVRRGQGATHACVLACHFTEVSTGAGCCVQPPLLHLPLKPPPHASSHGFPGAAPLPAPSTRNARSPAQAKAGDYISRLAFRHPFSKTIPDLLADNLGTIKDLDEPLEGKTLRMCTNTSITTTAGADGTLIGTAPPGSLLSVVDGKWATACFVLLKGPRKVPTALCAWPRRDGSEMLPKGVYYIYIAAEMSKRRPPNASRDATGPDAQSTTAGAGAAGGNRDRDAQLPLPPYIAGGAVLSALPEGYAEPAPAAPLPGGLLFKNSVFNFSASLPHATIMRGTPPWVGDLWPCGSRAFTRFRQAVLHRSGDECGNTTSASTGGAGSGRRGEGGATATAVVKCIQIVSFCDNPSTPPLRPGDLHSMAGAALGVRSNGEQVISSAAFGRTSTAHGFAISRD